jgi:spore coat protein A, manganese oxidase
MKTVLQRKALVTGFSAFVLTAAIFSGLMASGMSSPPVPGPITQVTNTVVCSGYPVSVPVTVANFNNVGGISLKLNFDVTQLSYQGASLNAALGVLNPVYGVVGGQFSLSASGMTGVTLPDNDVLFTLNFNAAPTAAGFTILSWSEVPGQCEYAPPPPGDPYVSVPFANYFINGTCNVKVTPAPSILGPASVCLGSTGVVYSTQAGKSNYVWAVTGGTITAGGTPSSNSVTVTWDTPGPGSVSVNYTDVNLCTAQNPTVLPVTVNSLPVPTITGPANPTIIGAGITAGQVFTTEAGMTSYIWTVSSAGTITGGTGTNSITVQWTNPGGNQSVTVTYTDGNGCHPATPAVYLVLYYPFPGPIDPTTIPQFVDPMPHFAAGLRIDAKAGGHLVIRDVKVQQKALSTGTPVTGGIVNDPGTPNAGLGNYAAYQISKDNGTTWGIAMWPAQTIEAQQGNQLVCEYRNELFGVTYNDFNILADQTLMMNGYPQNGNINTDPYTGPIPMSVHLHGGEMPSNSDGGPLAWFTPNYDIQGPGFALEASSTCTYPNMQEGTTLWYHPHDQGLTRINVYTGLAGYYFLRGTHEDELHLPGWSGDGVVREVTPDGKSPTFNGSNTYKPEVELAIQDRMFNVDGALYWPVAPTNPDIHPFWTPEFFGDVFTVNGKTWPYLSVAPRKYLFRMLDGCNARFLNMWLTTDTATGAHDGPDMTVLSTEGGFLSAPVTLSSAAGQTLFLAPAERPMVVIDFTGYAPGTKFYLMNDALAPYPTGDPVIPGLTDRIMQFVVNGEVVTPDNSVIPSDLRPTSPMVKLTNFDGTLNTTPVLKRQILLNEVSGPGGPVKVAVNNSHFDAQPDPAEPFLFGGPTETPTEGTTELWQIINTTADAHPMHPHLVQWQLVSRQDFNSDAYLLAYAQAWASQHPEIPAYPAGFDYPGGAGSPYPYSQLNGDGAVGGNPAVTPFITGPIIPARPEEQGWKDAIKSLPGQIETYMVRLTPTDKPINAAPEDLVFPFDPSLGPGYVYHCHIIDHEDMDMMRPLLVAPSPVRFPQISSQPQAFTACVGDPVTFTVVASSINPISYLWQISTDGGTVWTDLANGGIYNNVTTSSLSIDPASLSINTYKYRCQLTNADGVVLSNPATLTVGVCSVTGTLTYFNNPRTPITGMTVTVNSTPPASSGLTLGDGSFTVPSVPSGTFTISVNANGKAVGGINSTDAGAANYWGVNGGAIEQVKFLAGDVTNNNFINANDPQMIQQYFVFGTPFTRSPWSFWQTGSIIQNNFNPSPIPTTWSVTVNKASVSDVNLYGLCTGDFNGSFLPAGMKESSDNVQLTYASSFKAGANQSFDLPIHATSELEAGAVSLILNIPASLATVENVILKDSKEPVSFSVTGDELRIGWYSTTPVHAVPGSELLILKLRASPGFTEGKILKVGLANDPLNELADTYMQVIPNTILQIDQVEGGPIGIIETPESGLSLANYPNPFSDFSTISYTLPVEGKVSLVVRNMLGDVVRTLVDETQASGRHEFRLDGRSLPSGVYTAMLRLKSPDKDLVTLIKFVVTR